MMAYYPFWIITLFTGLRLIGTIAFFARWNHLLKQPDLMRGTAIHAIAASKATKLIAWLGVWVGSAATSLYTFWYTR